MNELAEIKTNEVLLPTENLKEKAVEYLSSMGLKIPEKHKTQFIELASSFGLNPFKREIYAVGYGENWNIITGYEVYLKRAERIGKLDGWKAEVNGNGNDMTATVTIYRKDWKMPFEHTVLFSEVCQKTKDGKLNSVWGKMPSFMCKKVAIAQAFRLCFPDEMGGMPYTADELPEIEIKAETKTIKAETKTVKTEKPVQEKAVALYTPEEAAKIGDLLKTEYEGRFLFNTADCDKYRVMLVTEGGQKTLEAVRLELAEKIKMVEADIEASINSELAEGEK